MSGNREVYCDRAFRFSHEPIDKTSQAERKLNRHERLGITQSPQADNAMLGLLKTGCLTQSHSLRICLALSSNKSFIFPVSARRTMSAIGPKWTLAVALHMSAFDPKRTSRLR